METEIRKQISKSKILFIDRDGTLIIEPKTDFQVDSLNKLEFYPQVFKYLGKIAEELDYILVIVTNQDGLGTDVFPESTFHPTHDKMMSAFENENIRFRSVHIDKSFEHENSSYRKPRTGMLTEYLNNPDQYDLKNSFVIGDRLTDIELAKNLGCKGILLHPNAETIISGHQLQDFCVLETSTWKNIYEFLSLPKRVAEIKRTTKETDIYIRLSTDGTGKADIKTGLNFFDHMLEQIARHSGCDLVIQTKGDLHIDEHHTIEDTALALGEAFKKVLGDKRGIERYGHWRDERLEMRDEIGDRRDEKGDTKDENLKSQISNLNAHEIYLPMDDALAQVGIDFGGRPWLVWNVIFHRERIGDVPTEMFYHFFKSFSDTALCNLNIKAEGTNEHHKIESVFKAFARAIKMAVKRDINSIGVLPSTKGVL